MSTILPTKSSSRAGRFKKKLVPESFLEKEAPVIAEKMAPFLAAFLDGSLSAAEFVALYTLSVLSYRYPGTWLGAKAPQGVSLTHQLSFPLAHLKMNWEPNIQRRLEGITELGDIFRLFALKSTPLTVNRSLLEWSNGLYGLDLMFRIPSPSEVLTQQKQGRRCVTVVLEPKRAAKFILGERDALGFTMHDLIHADHFYHNNQCYHGQLGFYGFLDHCMTQKHFDELLSHPKFEAEFEYLIADMNAYAIHLMKCFKSALLHYHPQPEFFFQNWLNKLALNDEEKKALRALNTSEYQSSDDQIILDFLSRYHLS